MKNLILANCTYVQTFHPSVILLNDASSYINRKSPIICKEITVKEASGDWYNSEIRVEKKC